VAKDDKKRPSGKPQLTGMAAALAKAGIVSEKQARAAQREQRKEARDLGEDVVAARDAAERAALAKRLEAEAEARRAADAAQVAAERRAAVLRAIEDGRIPGEGGQRRWFFVARDGRVPFLEVSDDAARALSDGRAGICELPQPDGPASTARVRHVLVGDEKKLQTIQGLDLDLVRFWGRDVREFRA
jgi:uncharacterized protein YaiL (DUF2058 family)